MILEVCVDHIRSVIAASKGGANRIELCSALSEGGLTPTIGFLKTAKRLTKIPIFAMLRPSPGGFIYTEEEKEIILSDLDDLKSAGADGFVVGALKNLNEIDIEFCTKIVNKAAPLHVTFHRAFDFTLPQEMDKNIEILITIGIKRVLTSGFSASAIKGLDHLERLSKFMDRIIIMPGAGVNMMNIREIIEKTGCSEIHASARSVVDETNTNSQIRLSESGQLMITNEDIVRQLIFEIEEFWNLYLKVCRKLCNVRKLLYILHIHILNFYK